MNQELTELANKIEDIYKTNEYSNMEDILKELNLKPKYMGKGAYRFSYLIKYKNNFYIIKFDEDACHNHDEIRIWKQASDELQKLLYGIFAWSEKRHIIIGEYVEFDPITNGGIIDSINADYRKLNEFRRKVIQIAELCNIEAGDLHEGNIRKRTPKRNFVVCDYGNFQVA